MNAIITYRCPLKHLILLLLGQFKLPNCQITNDWPLINKLCLGKKILHKATQVYNIQMERVNYTKAFLHIHICTQNSDC